MTMEGPKHGPKSRLSDPKVEAARTGAAAELRRKRKERDALTTEQQSGLHAFKRIVLPSRAAARDAHIAAAKETLKAEATQLLASEEVKRRDEDLVLQETVVGPLAALGRPLAQKSKSPEGILPPPAKGPTEEEQVEALNVDNLIVALRDPLNHDFLMQKLFELYNGIQQKNRFGKLREPLTEALLANLDIFSLEAVPEMRQAGMQRSYLQVLNKLFSEPFRGSAESRREVYKNIAHTIEAVVPNMDRNAITTILRDGNQITQYLFGLPEEHPLRKKFMASVGSVDGEEMTVGFSKAGPKAASYAIERIDPAFQDWYGISLSELLGMHRSKSAYTHVDIQKLFRSCADLENGAPGTVKRLFKDYGIRESYRYPREMLLKQLSEEGVDRPYGVIMYPYSDEIDAFNHKPERLKAFFDQIKALRAVKVFEVASSRDVARHLVKLGKQYSHKIDFAILGGHGSPESINFSDFTEFGSLMKDDLLGPGHGRARDFFTKDATIVLSSCSTGEVGGIAQRMRDVLGLKVRAPKEPAGVPHIFVREEDGKLEFEVTYLSTKLGKTEEVPTAQYDPEP